MFVERLITSLVLVSYVCHSTASLAGEFDENGFSKVHRTDLFRWSKECSKLSTETVERVWLVQQRIPFAPDFEHWQIHMWTGRKSVKVDLNKQGAFLFGGSPAEINCEVYEGQPPTWNIPIISFSGFLIFVLTLLLMPVLCLIVFGILNESKLRSVLIPLPLCFTIMLIPQLFLAFLPTRWTWHLGAFGERIIPSQYVTAFADADVHANVSLSDIEMWSWAYLRKHDRYTVYKENCQKYAHALACLLMDCTTIDFPDVQHEEAALQPLLARSTSMFVPILIFLIGALISYMVVSLFCVLVNMLDGETGINEWYDMMRGLWCGLLMGLPLIYLLIFAGWVFLSYPAIDLLLVLVLLAILLTGGCLLLILRVFVMNFNQPVSNDDMGAAGDENELCSKSGESASVLNLDEPVSNDDIGAAGAEYELGLREPDHVDNNCRRGFFAPSGATRVSNYIHLSCISWIGGAWRQILSFVGFHRPQPIPR